jgi:phospholipid transport system substrate-binding protein
VKATNARRDLKWWLSVLLASGAGLGMLASSALGQQAEPDPAVMRIRAFYGSLLATMKQADRLGIRGRYDKLEPVIRTTFDLAAMTRIAVGPDWNSISPEEQSELIDNFSRMTIATYASRFDGYSGEQFDVEAASEARNSGRIVRTRLIPASGDPVTLNYLMRGSGDSWKIVDVYLTGTISELATRRSEFGAILKAGGPNALIDSLRQQGARLLRSSGPKSDAGTP